MTGWVPEIQPVQHLWGSKFQPMDCTWFSQLIAGLSNGSCMWLLPMTQVQKCKTTRLGSTWSRKLCWIFLALHSTANPLTPFNWYSCITTHSRRISEVTSRVSINFENHKVFAGWNICPKERFKFNRKSKNHVKCILIKLREIPPYVEKWLPKATPQKTLENYKSVCLPASLGPFPTSRGKGPKWSNKN